MEEKPLVIFFIRIEQRDTFVIFIDRLLSLINDILGVRLIGRRMNEEKEIGSLLVFPYIYSSATIYIYIL